MIHRLFAPVALLCLATAAAAAPPDWSQWGGTPGRNMAWPGEVTLPATFDPGIRGAGRTAPDVAFSRNVRWIAPLGPRTYGSPVVSGGRILIGTATGGLAQTWGPAPSGVGRSGGNILCLDAATGQALWSLPLPKLSQRKSHHADSGYGVCATGTIEGNRAWIVSNRAEVLCLDMAGMRDGNNGPFTEEATLLAGETDRGEPLPPVEIPDACGDVLWRFDMVEEVKAHPHDASSSAVLVHGDFLYVSTGNGRNERENEVPSPDAPSLIVLDKQTGRLVATDAEEIGKRMWKSQWSSPALSVTGGRERIVFGAGDGCCYAFEPVRRADPEKVLALKKLWVTNCGNPEYLRPDFVLAERPTREPGPSEVVGTPVCHEGRVYVTVGRDPAHPVGKGCLTCLDARTGEVLWRYTEIGPCLATVSVADGLLYVGETRGDFHCLDAADGTLLWTQKARGQIWGSSMVADGKVYVPATRGLYVFAAGRAGKLLEEIRLDGPLCATPTVMGDALLIASARSLYAVAAGAEPPPAPAEPDPGDANVTLTLAGALGGAPVTVRATSRRGRFVHGFAEAGDATYDVDLADVEIDGVTMRGAVRVTDGESVVSELTIDVEAKLGALKGSYRAKAGGKRVNGTVEGRLGPPARALEPGRVVMELTGALAGPDGVARPCVIDAELVDAGVRGGGVTCEGVPLEATLKGGVTVYEDRFAANIRIVLPAAGDEKPPEHRIRAEGVCVGDICAGTFEATRTKKDPALTGRFRGRLLPEDEAATDDSH